MTKVNIETENYNIHQKMWLISAEISRVRKNLSVGVGKGSYKAVSELDILEAVKPLETKYRVYSYPVSREIVDSKILTKEAEYEGKITRSNSLFMRIQTKYRFVNVDNPEDYIEIDSYGDGIDTGDKATGKAMTYCDKYALMKAYKISTGDDPDATKSEEYNEVKSDKITARQVSYIKNSLSADELSTLLNKHHKAQIEDLTKEEASIIITTIKNRKETVNY